MNLYSQFATDSKLENDGIVLNYGVNDHGENIDIRIARAGGQNTKFAKVAEVVLKPYRRQLANENMDPKALDKLFHVIYAKAVVVSWAGVRDPEGLLIPCTEENVVKLFNDLPDLFADIRQAADKASLFRATVLEEESKNS